MGRGIETVSWFSSVAPILEALVNVFNLDHLALRPSLAVDVFADRLREELANHLRLGCAKREGATHDVVEPSKLVVARVVGVTLHLEGDIQELLGFYCISHNWE